MITKEDLQREGERGGVDLERGRGGTETEIMAGEWAEAVDEGEVEKGGGVDPRPHNRTDHLVALEDKKLRPCTSECVLCSVNALIPLTFPSTV